MMYFGNIKKDSVFLATNKLLCEVDYIKNGVAYCNVINGLWSIGFDIKTGQCVEKGTDKRALPGALASKILIVGKFKGDDYNECINDAEIKYQEELAKTTSL